MWRHALIPVLGIALLACGGGDGAPAQPTVTPTPVPTATAEPKSQGESSCIEQFPDVTLHYGEQAQQDPYLSYSWIGEDCAVDGHPFFTIPLPASALTLPAGARPVLTFSEAPRSVDASVRPLPLDATFPTTNGIEMDVNVYNGIPKEPLDVKPVAEQELDLGSLPPGNYVVEIGSGWPEGSLGFAFRIEIVDAVDE